MSTSVSVNTYTHSVTYVTDQMLSSLRRIVTLSGLDPEKFISSWALTERAVKTWLDTKHLEKVTLEVYKPYTNQLITRWDFDIDYTYATGDEGAMWADTAAIEFAIRKAGEIPSLCTYRILLKNKAGYPSVSGWSVGSYLDTSEFTRRPIGTTIGASHLGTGTSYWTK